MKLNQNMPLSCIAVKDEPAQQHIPSHIAPLYLSSTYIYDSPEKAHSVFSGKNNALIYGRWSHPNAEIAEAKIGKMEGFGTATPAKALLFNSGMAAITALFETVLQPGNSLIVQGNIYGTTYDYLQSLSKKFNLQLFFVDMADLKTVEKRFKEQPIQMIYAESPANPTLNCYDLKKIASMAHRYGAVAAIDSTFASPLLQHPLQLGFDVVVHSSTKYLNGHGNSLSGVIISCNLNYIEKEVWNYRKLHGSIISPMDAWLLNQGLKTLHLRMPQHCNNAMAVATFLQKHPAVAAVHYPGLKTHPDHHIAKKQMTAFGGVLSFELKGGIKAGKKLMKAVKWCQLTASLGATDTLIQHPASMSHSFVPKATRLKFGITDGLVRLSVGIEDASVIINDLRQALA
ncbi:MAG: aminotransferase class I/II-fold pyridoxal phosphate-dependent enzyme [Chitinophagales bacterium]